MNIYGARIDPSGNVLDPGGVLVATEAYRQQSPEVAFGGNNHLVAWADYRSGLYWDIYGTRIGPAGVVLDPGGIPIATGAYSQADPAAAFNGRDYLVVWTVRRDGYTDIFGTRVDPIGNVLDPNGIAVACGSYWKLKPVVESDGTNFLVVWEDRRSGLSDIYGARVSPAGAVLDPGGFPIATGALYPAIAFDGNNFLVIWLGQGIYGARVSPTGVVLDPGGFAIAAGAEGWCPMVVAFDGSNYLVVWSDYHSGYLDIYGARVSPAGRVLDPNGFTIAAGADHCCPVLAFDGTDYLVVWESRHRSTYSDIYGARVKPDGTVFDKGPVVRRQGNQLSPALARGPGSELFLVYEGWVDTYANKTYNTRRIWGILNPSPGVAEVRMQDPFVDRLKPITTIVRGVLFLSDALISHRISLISSDGRKVMNLQPGENDVRHLSPGVYFLRTDLRERSLGPSAEARAGYDFARKVVIQR